MCRHSAVCLLIALALVRPSENCAVFHGCAVRLELHSHKSEDRNNLRMKKKYSFCWCLSFLFIKGEYLTHALKVAIIVGVASLSPAQLELLLGLLVSKPASALISCPLCGGGRSSNPPRTEREDAEGAKLTNTAQLGARRWFGGRSASVQSVEFNFLSTRANLAIDALLHSVSEH